MKDKELRKLLADTGIVRETPKGDLLVSYQGEEINHLKRQIGFLQDCVSDLADVVKHCNETIHVTNEHYGIVVEKEDAKLVVKEL